MLFKFRLLKQDALSSLTKLLHWCLGRSLLYFPEDPLDPTLCGIKTNRVNIFLAASILGLNISKHVKLTFLRCCPQDSCRLQQPENPDELASGGAPPLQQAALRAAVAPGLAKPAREQQVCSLPISTHREGAPDGSPSRNV